MSQIGLFVSRGVGELRNEDWDCGLCLRDDLIHHLRCTILLVLKRPFARHVPSTSSRFQRGNTFGFCVALWQGAVVLASRASEKTAVEKIVLILFT